MNLKKKKKGQLNGFFYLTTVKIMVYLKVCPFLSNSMCLFIHKTSFQRKKLNLVLWIVLVSLHLAEIMNNLNGEITACSSRFVAKKNKKNNIYLVHYKYVDMFS